MAASVCEACIIITALMIATLGNLATRQIREIAIDDSCDNGRDKLLPPANEVEREARAKSFSDNLTYRMRQKRAYFLYL